VYREHNGAGSESRATMGHLGIIVINVFLE
jgi:hypothetical protein